MDRSTITRSYCNAENVQLYPEPSRAGSRVATRVTVRGVSFPGDQGRIRNNRTIAMGHYSAPLLALSACGD